MSLVMKALGRRPGTLQTEQLAAYRERGYVLVPGLIDERTVAEAASILSDRLKGKDFGPHQAFCSDRELLACYTSEVCWTAAQLAGVSRPFKPPRSTSTISVLPGAGEWRWPVPHLDHAKREDGHPTFPPPYQIACIIYLSNVRAHSGGTVVWPESHKQIEMLAQSRNEEYAHLWKLHRDLSLLDLKKPLEIEAAAGDVLFLHYLCAHAGSLNTGAEPRLALNHKW
jgi:hypothetical protein